MSTHRGFGRVQVLVLLAAIAVLLGTGCPDSGTSHRIATAPSPEANAGPDTTVAVRSLVRLDGSRSTQDGEDYEIVTYRWGIVSHPPGSDVDQTLTYNTDYPFGYIRPDSVGTYELQLQVVNNAGKDDDDNVIVTAQELGVPLADAGPDQMVDVGTPGTLDGSGSVDYDGDPLSYHWQALSSGGLTITDEDSVYAQFVLTHPGVQEVELTVSDGIWDHKDVVQISSNPPTITSVDPLSGSVGTVITIAGTNFSPVPSRNTVTVGGAEATVLTASATQITAEVPPGPYPDPSMTIIVVVSGITHGPDTAIGPEFSVAAWVQVSSVGTYDWHDVDFLGVTFGVVVGAVGQINITYNISQPWEHSNSGTGAELRGVCVIDAGVACAVGNDGTILRTEDYGATWVSQTSNTWEDLWGVDFVDAAHGIAVGMNATIAVTSDSGNIWTATWRVNNRTDPLFAVEMFDQSNAVASGTGIMFRTSDGGASWQTQALPNPNVGIGMCWTDQNTGAIVGHSGSIIRTTNGTDWTDVSVSTLNQLYDVSFYDSNTGVVVGTNIYRTTTGGADWHMEFEGSWTAHGVHMVSSEVGFAVGEAGAIMKRTAE